MKLMDTIDKLQIKNKNNKIGRKNTQKSSKTTIKESQNS